MRTPSQKLQKKNSKKKTSERLYLSLQTEDKVHGLRRGFFYTKVSQTQYLSGIEALFVL